MPLALLPIVPLLTEIFKFINLMIEGKPMEQRQAESIIWFQILWAPFKPLFPADIQAAVERLMASIVEHTKNA